MGMNSRVLLTKCRFCMVATISNRQRTEEIWTEVGLFSGRHRIDIRPTSYRHRIDTRPTSDRHQTDVGSTSGRHRIYIRPISGRHRIGIGPTSDQHQTDITLHWLGQHWTDNGPTSGQHLNDIGPTSVTNNFTAFLQRILNSRKLRYIDRKIYF